MEPLLMTPYKLPLFPCQDCGRPLRPPYQEVLFTRDGTMFFTASCDQCKTRTQKPFNILALIGISEGCDGFKPTRN